MSTVKTPNCRGYVNSSSLSGKAGGKRASSGAGQLRTDFTGHLWSPGSPG